MRLAVASGKGGTGKTTVALSLAFVAGDSVMYVDCDVEEPNAHIFLRPRITNSTVVHIPVPSVDETRCTHCGECVQACPTGALTAKKSYGLAVREDKIDTVRTTCPYCGVGCQLNLSVKDGRIIEVNGVEDGSPNKGSLCVKGRFGYDFIYSKERLTEPLIRRQDGSFRTASWDEALDLIASKFSEAIENHGPDAVAGVACARSINEDNYQMQKLFRAVFKTNNIDHCART